jgi:hypothetical protein
MSCIILYIKVDLNTLPRPAQTRIQLPVAFSIISFVINTFCCREQECVVSPSIFCAEHILIVMRCICDLQKLKLKLLGRVVHLFRTCWLVSCPWFFCYRDLLAQKFVRNIFSFVMCCMCNLQNENEASRNWGPPLAFSICGFSWFVVSQCPNFMADIPVPKKTLRPIGTVWFACGKHFDTSESKFRWLISTKQVDICSVLHATFSMMHSVAPNWWPQNGRQCRPPGCKRWNSLDERMVQLPDLAYPK